MLSDLHSFMNRRAKVIRRQSMARLSGPLLPASFLSEQELADLPSKPRSSSVQSASERRQSQARGLTPSPSFARPTGLAPVEETAGTD